MPVSKLAGGALPAFLKLKNCGKLITVWGIFHVGFIMLICSYSAYHKYCRFYKISENALVKKVNAAAFFNKPMLCYGKITGTGTGYGFFAPNIKSSGIIMGDCDGKKIYPVFNSFESAMRFSVLSSRVTDYLTSSDEPTGILDKELRDKYYGLIFKSIGVKIYNQNHCTQDTFFVSYNILDFPELKTYHKTKGNYRLRQVKEVKLFRHDNVGP
jgi:hypothetical protein